MRVFLLSILLGFVYAPFTQARSLVLLQWERIPGFKRYVVETFNLDLTKKWKTYRTQKNQLRISIPYWGNFYLRIKAFSRTQKMYTEYYEVKLGEQPPVGQRTRMARVDLDDIDWQDELPRKPKLKRVANLTAPDDITLEDITTSDVTEYELPTRIKEKARARKRQLVFHSAFYTASQGTFAEGTPDGDVTTSEMNSPVTFGYAGGFKKTPISKNSYSYSLYASQLTAATSSQGSGKALSPPWEIGTNFYWNRKSRLMPYYFGIDYERFSHITVFDGDFDIVKHSMGFLSAGIGRMSSIGRRKFLWKWSVSQSVLSTVSASDPTMTEFSGWKSILYVNTSASKLFLIHFLAKYHSLSNQNNWTLDILRLGLGVGMKF